MYGVNIKPTRELHMTDTVDTQASRTNLEVPNDLMERIKRQATKDRRSYKSEILELLEEAVETREGRNAL